LFGGEKIKHRIDQLFFIEFCTMKRFRQSTAHLYRPLPDQAIIAVRTPDDASPYTAVDEHGGLLTWVKRKDDMDALWYGGMFGKGTQSRSQPTWMERMTDSPVEEWMVLSPHETIHLALHLRCLIVRDASGETVPIEQLWERYCRASLVMASPFSYNLEVVDRAAMIKNDFIAQHVAYHFYRTQGWVVRTGIKYGCHWMLYRRGPVFDHGAYAVTVVPLLKADAMPVSWPDMLSSMRVQATVKKRLRLCMVVAAGVDEDAVDLERLVRDPLYWLQIYRVKDADFDRWIPERTRE
jgi:tRNA splicing endonuclease